MTLKARLRRNRDATARHGVPQSRDCLPGTWVRRRSGFPNLTRPRQRLIPESAIAESREINGRDCFTSGLSGVTIRDSLTLRTRHSSMAAKDLDLDQLAAYLHLTPAQVAKLADREKIPGRRIAGQWRFSEAEIHHWLEERIGVANEQELADVQGVLERTAEADEPAIQLREFLLPEAIAAPLKARTRTSVIKAMAELASQTGMLWDADKMAEAVKAREDLHPTALESGVALLHPRRPQTSILAQAILAVGRTAGPVPFGGPGGGMTDIFFLICSTGDREHLRLLAHLSRILADADLLAAIRAASGPKAVYHALLECESKYFPDV